MSEITITEQDKKLLDLIAKGEAVRSNPYCSVYPGHVEPSLTQMSLSEVQLYQQRRIDAGFRSSAVGRYQFIKRTLTAAIENLGVDPLRTRYTEDVQDALIIGILKRYRRYDDWLAGTYSTDKFMIKLAQEFASFPVPYAMQGANRRLQKGESYYAGDSLNRSNHDPDTLFVELEDIRTGGVGGETTIPVNEDGPSGVIPAAGQSQRSQVAAAAAGVGVGAYNGGNAGTRRSPASTLPAASGTIYRYKVIDPLDDRYDFRTGDKVKDILIHGTNAAAATPQVNPNIGAAQVSTTNAGAAPPSTVSGTGLTEEQQRQILLGETTEPTVEPTRAPCPQPVSIDPNIAGGIS